MWIDIIWSVEGPNRTKRWKMGEFTLWAKNEVSPALDILVLGFSDSDQDLHHQSPDSQVIRIRQNYTSGYTSFSGPWKADRSTWPSKLYKPIYLILYPIVLVLFCWRTMTNKDGKHPHKIWTTLGNKLEKSYPIEKEKKEAFTLASALCGVT